ncbi:MAG: hypothetical protein R3E79_48565 [Caldilineaceae bacterium]
MGRLLTFALGVVMGVVLKWQYDEQLAPSDPGQNDQTAGGEAPSDSAYRCAGDFDQVRHAGCLPSRCSDEPYRSGALL